jgi:Uma2 family endonuclease
MAIAQLPGEHHILLENITWETYERLLREAGERHIRMTYDNGDLEIMTLSFGHENAGEIIGLLIRALALVLSIPLRSGGSTTLRKKLKRKGLEPDKCYWIKNEKTMCGKGE